MGEATGGGKPLDQMTEDELLGLAWRAMFRAASQPRRSPGWSVQWAVHDKYMDELARRAASILASIPFGGAP
jgi:hypothetical protein